MTPILLAAFCLALAGPAMAGPPADLLARGEYLVRGPMGCGNCHTPLGPEGPVAGMELAGRLVEDNPGFTAYAPNITPAGAIADWSDEELSRAIREGLRPDGSLIGPPMPFAAYRGISDSDLAAIVAFLRSVAPAEQAVPASSYRIPLPPAYGPPVGHVDAPPPGVTVAQGEYIALHLAHCMECHSPMTPQGPDYATGLGQGGFVFRGPWGETVAPNITSGPDGIAGLDDAALKAMITEGRRPDGSQMTPPMPYGYLAQMQPADLEAVILYLRSLPPLPGN
ncbi:c-type cytochrome [Poseidonocella sp. HB161398]|uniref:c-type cytochrome n=1 Tax=Poseidonocella sp. HB161398 TaxID=2320855 RepID=UPI001108E63F|nr:c-type cytochrome [Poseidonocella sp. HB161398]